MKEIKQIIETFDSIDRKKQKAALATVVRIQGSSYRQPGARMLILDNGQWIGAISGGCLEGDALRKAREVMASGKARHIVYDTRKDKPADHIPFSMGCEGIIEVLIEPLQKETDPLHPISIFRKYQRAEQDQFLVTLYHVTDEKIGLPGESLWIDNQGKVLDDFSNSRLSEVVKNEVNKRKQWKNSFQKEVTIDKDKAYLFYEIMRQPIHLMIYGGGYDVVPVVNLAKNLGWRVSVADECIAKTFPQKFPLADQVLNIAGKDVYNESRNLQKSYALVMSHNFKYDMEVLNGLLKTDIPYIGILGPKKRMGIMLEELGKNNAVSPDELDKRIFAPVGLNIGAETPDEIALSILSEILAFHNKKPAGFLKDKKGHIHDRESSLEIDEVMHTGERPGRFQPG